MEIITKLKTFIAFGITSAAKVSYIPKLFTTKKVGIIPPEKYIVNKISPESTFLPGKFGRDKAYAAAVVKTNPKAVPAIVIIIVTLREIQIVGRAAIFL